MSQYKVPPVTQTNKVSNLGRISVYQSGYYTRVSGCWNWEVKNSQVHSSLGSFSFTGYVLVIIETKQQQKPTTFLNLPHSNYPLTHRSRLELCIVSIRSFKWQNSFSQITLLTTPQIMNCYSDISLWKASLDTFDSTIFLGEILHVQPAFSMRVNYD